MPDKGDRSSVLRKYDRLILPPADVPGAPIGEARNMKHWLIHTAVFVFAQIIFVALGFSWPWEVLTGQLPVNSIFDTVQGQLWTANVSRVWTIVWLADTAYSLGSLLRKSPATDQAAGPK